MRKFWDWITGRAARRAKLEEIIKWNERQLAQGKPQRPIPWHLQ